MSSLRNRTSGFHSLIKIDYGLVKFNIHRKALKLNKLQQFLMLNEINTSTECATIENAIAKEMSLHGTLEFISKCLNYSNQLGHSQNSGEKIALYVFEIFENDKSQMVGMREVMAFLILLSCDDVSKKYHALFNLYSGSAMRLSRLQLSHMLRDIELISRSINESFGNIDDSIIQCFEGIPVREPETRISREHFVKWSTSDKNECLSWIAAMHRLQVVSLRVQHDKCSLCKVVPVLGLMFIRSDMCMVCFLSKKAYALDISECRSALATDDRMAVAYVNNAECENKYILEVEEATISDRVEFLGLRERLNNISMAIEEYRNVLMQTFESLNAFPGNLPDEIMPVVKGMQEATEANMLTNVAVENMKCAISCNHSGGILKRSSEK